MKDVRGIFVVAVLILVAITGVAFAWTSTLPSASNSTLGENQKREMLKANIEELRTAIDALDARFVNYTSIQE